MHLRWELKYPFNLCAFLSLLFCSACSNGLFGGGTLQYTPPFGLISFSINERGIVVNADATVVTPLGDFEYQYPLASTSIDDGVLVIDIRYKKNGVSTDSVYSIHTNNDEITVTTNGHSIIHISNHRVLIDASTGSVQTVEIRDTQSSSPTTSSPIEAQKVVQTYYDDINSEDFQAAYNAWWHDPSDMSYPSYEKFAAGYSTTPHDDVTIENAGVISNGDIEVNVTLSVQDINGARTYQGYYIVGMRNGEWKLIRGKLQLSSN